jgi:hypothetical protein
LRRSWMEEWVVLTEFKRETLNDAISSGKWSAVLSTPIPIKILKWSSLWELR